MDVPCPDEQGRPKQIASQLFVTNLSEEASELDIYDLFRQVCTLLMHDPVLPNRWLSASEALCLTADAYVLAARVHDESYLLNVPSL
jgi:hypothetical protein